MAKYIDQHPMRPFTPEQFQELQNAPRDEFGVKHENIIFSEKDNKAWCILDALIEKPLRSITRRQKLKLTGFMR
jgi:hypothetical protein